MSNKPERQVRAGQVSISIWKNTETINATGKEFDKISVTIQRTFKQGNEWKNSNSLRIDDIPNAIQTLQEIYREFGVKTF